MALLEQAVANGRFQPLHNEHLTYLLEALQASSFLWIGITEFDIRNLEPCAMASHRGEPTSNPLTYSERVSIITAALEDEGVPRSRFGFLPFPIDKPDLLPDFVDLHLPILTTVCEPWNREKKRRLEELGYAVVVLYERNKRITGAQVRALVAARDLAALSKLVPRATLLAIERLQLWDRLQQQAS